MGGVLTASRIKFLRVPVAGTAQPFMIQVTLADEDGFAKECISCVSIEHDLSLVGSRPLEDRLREAARSLSTPFAYSVPGDTPVVEAEGLL